MHFLVQFAFKKQNHEKFKEHQEMDYHKDLSQHVKWIYENKKDVNWLRPKTTATIENKQKLIPMIRAFFYKSKILHNSLYNQYGQGKSRCRIADFQQLDKFREWENKI